MGLRPRVIPVLLLQNGKLVKTKRFKHPSYVGDPINAVKIFNEKEVDELLLLDIGCSVNGIGPDFGLIHKIISEAFMPVGYGGGIYNVEQAKRIFELGIEKVLLNSVLYHNLELVSEIGCMFGSSSIVCCIDYKKNIFGKNRVYFQGGKVKTNLDPVEWALTLQDKGAGEIIINCIDREGVYNGYDYDLLTRMSVCVSVPIVISGGASSIEDFKNAVQSGASGMAVGSMFIYKRPHNAVLLSYPSINELKKVYCE